MNHKNTPYIFFFFIIHIIIASLLLYDNTINEIEFIYNIMGYTAGTFMACWSCLEFKKKI